MKEWTIEITQKMKAAMDRYPKVDWNKVAEEGIKKEIQKIESKKK
ncbi:MAG TPA: hypothetical protein PLK55_04345 [archaeon]|nr:hypothetical protein [archaeon]